jgi:membrane protein
MPDAAPGCACSVGTFLAAGCQAMTHALRTRANGGLSLFWKLLRLAYDQYSRERAELLAASLAFYMLLSLAPLIIIAVAIAGLALGEGTVRGELSRLLTSAMGQRASGAIDGWVDEAYRNGALASVVGFGLALFTASRIVTQLEQILNEVWNVDEPDTNTVAAWVREFLRRRLFAILIVVTSGPLLLVVLGTRALLSTTSAWISTGTGLSVVVQLSQLVFALIIVTLLTGLVFKLASNSKLDWRSIWLGALVTSVLFNVGNIALGLYLGRASVSAAYGAAGSAIVVLLWLYFSGMFFLFGAEFAQAYAQELHYTSSNASERPLPDSTTPHRV